MSTVDRLLLLCLTLALWALAFGQIERAHAQESFQVTSGFKEAVERVVDGFYVRAHVDQTCYVNNGEVQGGAKKDVSYIHC